MSVRGAGKKAIVDASRLTGPEKSAVVLLALGEEHMALWQALGLLERAHDRAGARQARDEFDQQLLDDIGRNRAEARHG